MNAPANNIIEKLNPANGEKIGDYPITTPDEVEAAVALAKEAQPRWGALAVEERIQRLKRLRDICVEDQDALARRISLDTGKPYAEALMTEVSAVPLFLDFYEKEAPKVLRDQKVKTPIVLPGQESWVTYYPLGVIAVISPWNFPFRLAMVPTLSALIAGNTVVLKPSEVTPETAELMRELFERANLGRGVVQILQGDGSTGAALCEADVDKIFFTGSVATGRKVMAAAAKKPIPCELELGGKDPMIVCHDADLDRAAKAAVWAGLTNCGQMCTSVERLLVVESVHDAFVKKVVERVKKLNVGAPEEHADMGPMCFPPQLDTVESHVDDAVAKGAEVLTGGGRIDRPGQWFEPTVLTRITDDMEIWREETFGPVLPIRKVRDEDEAVAVANAHKFGLTGSVWTEDRDRGFKLASRLEAGQIHVNNAILITGNPALPFGGVKESGIGRYHSAEGLLGFVNTRAVMVDKGWFKDEFTWFPYRRKYPIALKAFRALFGGNLPKALIDIMRLRKLTD